MLEPKYSNYQVARHGDNKQIQRWKSGAIHICCGNVDIEIKRRVEEQDAIDMEMSQSKLRGQNGDLHSVDCVSSVSNRHPPPEYGGSSEDVGTYSCNFECKFVQTVQT